MLYFIYLEILTEVLYLSNNSVLQMFRIYHIISFTLIKKYFAMSCCGVKIVTVSIERHLTQSQPKEM